jgi:hypothetical protein
VSFDARSIGSVTARRVRVGHADLVGLKEVRDVRADPRGK